jgi:pSer/pThr/pTyr-binding forkhead associated (FHA) protein
MATLVYTDSDGIDRSVSVGTAPVTVGRSAECIIRSEDSRLSRMHARFFWDQTGSLWVEDLGSANGIFVGPAKVTSR